MLKLFACYIGGRTSGGNIEIHDLQFSIGEKIEDCFNDLRSKRIGDKDNVHIDSFLELKYIGGYEVTLKPGEKSKNQKKLFVVNAGGYLPDYFGELHEIGFYVAEKESEATKAALKHLCKDKDKQHQDDLYDVDDCIAIEEVSGYHIHLTPTDKTQDFIPMRSGYGKFNKDITSQIVHNNY